MHVARFQVAMPSSAQYTLLLLALTKMTRKMVIAKEISSKTNNKEKTLSGERVSSTNQTSPI